jgi:hypothetical protein
MNPVEREKIDITFTLAAITPSQSIFVSIVDEELDSVVTPASFRILGIEVRHNQINTRTLTCGVFRKERD